MIASMQCDKVLAFLLLGMVLVLGQVNKSATYDYGVVIDLGSKGSRVSVFMWPSDSDEPYTEVEFGGGKDPWYFKITPGVATLAGNPKAAGPYMKPLLDFASSVIPSSQLSSTPIFVRGTDTLRQLPNGQSEALLAAIYNYTALNYSFLMTPNCVSLLSGILEAGFMWVAANYLQENFQDNKDTIGTLDMGSGSTQIAFLPKSGTFLPTGYYYLFTYEKINYTPYAHSFTGYGYVASLYTINNTLIQQTSSDTVANPCLLAGYSSPIVVGDRTIVMQGTGSWSQCSSLTYNFLNTTAPCNYSPCSFDGAFQPALYGDFLAVSNFVDVESFLGYSDTASIRDLIEGGIKFCALSWQEAQEKYPDENTSDLSTFCFGANYLSMLLSQGYGFSLDTEINFSKTDDNDPYSWTLGAMIYELQMGW